MAILAVQDASSGAAVTLAAAAAGGDQIPAGTAAGGWRGGAMLLVRNANVGAARTVTVAQQPGAAVVVEIPASGFAVIPVNRIYQGQLVDVTYSNSAADLTVAAVRATPADHVG